MSMLAPFFESKPGHFLVTLLHRSPPKIGLVALYPVVNEIDDLGLDRDL